ncbi:MAG: 30S ribosomal protein S13 [Nanoarchaeota archaeon]|nr:30S ribosomal protein S13 [Nanoarchaeota archaeon]
MAEEKKKPVKEQEEKKKHQGKEERDNVSLIRVLGKDIRGDKQLFAGLTQIKGISWAFANATCKILKLDKTKKIQDVSPEELAKIEAFVKNPQIPGFLKNRQKDLADGKDKHLSGADLKLQGEFDIKRLKKIKSYKGIRHSANLPVRGQRTKSNFRRNRKPSVAAGKKK